MRARAAPCLTSGAAGSPPKAPEKLLLVAAVAWLCAGDGGDGDRSSALEGRLPRVGSGVFALDSCLTATSEGSKSREKLRAQVNHALRIILAQQGESHRWRGCLDGPADDGRKNCRTYTSCERGECALECNAAPFHRDGSVRCSAAKAS